MFGPGEVEELMNSEGITTDDLERLRLFYNAQLKDKGLDEILDSVEKVIAKNQEILDIATADVTTPRQNSSTIDDIA